MSTDTVHVRAVTLVAGLAGAARDRRSGVAVVSAEIRREREAERPPRHDAVGPQVPLDRAEGPSLKNASV